jgi:hypothetical protein
LDWSLVSEEVAKTTKQVETTKQVKTTKHVETTNIKNILKLF